MKTYYSDFIGHCARYYARCVCGHVTPDFASDAERGNYMACDAALRTFGAVESRIILEVYAHMLPGSVVVPSISCTVRRIAEQHKTTPESVWKLISTFERRAAKKRGLL